MSNLDRTLRIIAAAVCIALFYSGTVPGALGVMGLAIATIFLGTAIFGNCPLYSLLGIRTCPKES